MASESAPSGHSMKSKTGGLPWFMEGALNGAYSDLTIECPGAEFKVHKLIMCQASEHFDAACKLPSKDGVESKISLSEAKADEVRVMIDCLYLGSYDQERTISLPWSVNLKLLAFHARLFRLADKYLVPMLREKAIRHLRRLLDGNLEAFRDPWLQDLVTKSLQDREKPSEKNESAESRLERLLTSWLSDIERFALMVADREEDSLSSLDVAWGEAPNAPG